MQALWSRGPETQKEKAIRLESKPIPREKDEYPLFRRVQE